MLYERQEDRCSAVEMRSGHAAVALTRKKMPVSCHEAVKALGERARQGKAEKPCDIPPRREKPGDLLDRRGPFPDRPVGGDELDRPLESFSGYLRKPQRYGRVLKRDELERLPNVPTAQASHPLDAESAFAVVDENRARNPRKRLILH
jgi:hypothetical protein